MEPHLFIIRKQKRDSPDKVTLMLAYYILDGSIYQAPQLCNVFAARVQKLLPLLHQNWRRLDMIPPAPLPPPFPDGFIPPKTTEVEKDPENQQEVEPQPPVVDPIIDQGPAKRTKF
ncbi:mediator of RNA polymerase II transcription subunit 6-like [Durio zibethinus]|uniref:Mediator of RNA polymerase II transcription subunit 6 n=1 Tax=Durio zibethinus TaxID=66656 RepID=A0A6P5WG79_DURZI|nr:mediator of RNA polymerase II transcription subunit 6-like [Durio zibethinus]